MVTRGYTKSSWYLIDVEAGFELWQGGAGLETNSFSVNINGTSPTSPPSSTPTPTATQRPLASSPTPTPSGTGTCSGAYSVTDSLGGRLPGTGRGHQHRIGHAEQLATRLDLPWQPGD